MRKEGERRGDERRERERKSEGDEEKRRATEMCEKRSERWVKGGQMYIHIYASMVQYYSICV